MAILERLLSAQSFKNEEQIKKPQQQQMQTAGPALLENGTLKASRVRFQPCRPD